MKISGAYVLGIIAIVLACAGGAVAATAITGAQIKNNSITGLDIKNKSLSPIDFRGSVRGPQGPAGAQGPSGPPGPVAVSQIVRVTGSLTVAAGDIDGGFVSCPAGMGVIGGGFSGVGADAEVFVNDSNGSTTSWSGALDNFDSSVDGTLTVVAYCSTVGAAVARSKNGDPQVALDKLIAERRALHEAS